MLFRSSARNIVTPYITSTRFSVETVCTRAQPSEYSPRPRHTPAKSQMCRDTPGPADVPTETPIRPCQGLSEALADEFLRCRPIGVGGVHGALLPGLTQVDTAVVCVKMDLTGRWVFPRWFNVGRTGVPCSNYRGVRGRLDYNNLGP